MVHIGYLFEDSRNFGKNTKQMLDHFIDRTNYHIQLVQKYLDKIISLNDSRLDRAALEEEKQHDQSKFKEPELTPYVFVNWKYHLKDRGEKFDPPKDIIDLMNNATFHHISTNKHHPDYWDTDLSIKNLNSTDRDKPPEKIVDATKMPLIYVASMVADWLAMSEEKKTCPYEWAKNNIGIRWKFDQNQIKLIYDLIDKIWKK